MTASPTNPPQTSKSRDLGRGLVLGFGIAVVVFSILAVAYFFYNLKGDSLPTVTPSLLESAQEKWQENGPRSYSFTLKITTQETSVYKVSVIEQEVVGIIRDGKDTKTKEDETPQFWKEWSIPGVFHWIENYFEDDEKKSEKTSHEENVKMQAVFDPKLGYPAQFRRLEMKTNYEISWEITDFQEITANKE